MLYLVLLLLLSGDVELNPGPLTGKDPSYILRTRSYNLTQAVSDNLANVAAKLFNEGLIPKQTHDDALMMGVINEFIKSTKLVGVLQNQLSCSGDPSQYLINVCNALKELNDASLTKHANAMLEELGISSGSTQQVQIPQIPTLPTTSDAIDETDDPNGGAMEAKTTHAHVPDPPDVSELCPEMDDIDIKPERLTPELIADVNIILVTATDTEYCAVMGTGRKIVEDEQGYTQVELDDVTFNLVMYGSYKVAVIRTGQGPGRTEAMLEKIQAVIKAQYVIAVGICYGMKKGKVNIGDTIVAESIMDTSSRRASGHELPARPEEYKSGGKLRNVFIQKQGFKLEKGDGTKVAIHCGVLVSENTLVASQEYKEDILKQIPQALGGEMEGAGLMTAAEKGKYEGIVIKAVADWGNEDKEPYRKWQEFAAVGAAKYLLYRLQATEKFKKQ